MSKKDYDSASSLDYDHNSSDDEQSNKKEIINQLSNSDEDKNLSIDSFLSKKKK